MGLLRILAMVIITLTTSHAKCHGKFVNPITDVCWSCLFPITIGGLQVSASGEDTPNVSPPICMCPRPPLGQPFPGVPITFWEPVRLVDVTREPYCLVNMGGIHMMNQGVKGHGSVANGLTGRTRSSFYQVHWYMYPLLYWMEILMDFMCIEVGSPDLTYMSEIDPFWDDDETAFILNPEAILFANPIAQASCAVDCVASSVGFPLDPMFWCGGCQGSLYPFVGTVSSHIGGVQASLLLVQRMIAKLHREGLLWGTAGPLGMCQKFPMPIIQKSQYKTQMTYPIPSTGSRQCHPLGRSEQLWAAGKEFPYQGEDFGYLIWRKRSCCLL